MESSAWPGFLAEPSSSELTNVPYQSCFRSDMLIDYRRHFAAWPLAWIRISFCAAITDYHYRQTRTPSSDATADHAVT